MTLDQITEQINKLSDKYNELLPISDSITSQSEVKASQFLIALTKFAQIRDTLLNMKVSKDSLLAIAFNEAIRSSVGSDAKTREAGAKANPDYLAINEQVDMIDNKLLYLKTLMEVYNNAHLLNRALLKNEL